VGDVVLDLRQRALALDAGDLRGPDLAGEIGILTKGVESSAPTGVAIHVDERFEDDVLPECPRVAADRYTIVAGIRRAERCGDAPGVRDGGGMRLGDDARGTVGEFQGRDAQPSNPR